MFNLEIIVLKRMLSPLYFNLQCVDTTPGRSEKLLGADMAFVLSVRIPETITRHKVIFVQAKKMNVTANSQGVAFHESWDIDNKQLGDLNDTTPFGYYFLYGPAFNSTNIRVIPAHTIKAILDASSIKGVIHKPQVMSSSRPFSEFLVNDFIGCWVGDDTEKALGVARGKNKDSPFPVRYVIEVSVSLG